MTTTDIADAVASLHDRFDKLASDLDSVIRGLMLMNQTLGAHGTMLGEILEAATAELPESDLGEKLDRIAEAMEAQTAAFVGLDRRLSSLPRDIADAIAKAV